MTWASLRKEPYKRDYILQKRPYLDLGNDIGFLALKPLQHLVQVLLPFLHIMYVCMSFLKIDIHTLIYIHICKVFAAPRVDAAVPPQLKYCK